MASTKEAMVIILDVGKNSLQEDPQTKETFLDKEKKCCIRLFQRKIFSAKNDEIALVLMGTKDTNNELNSTIGGYENICEAVQLSLPNWDMIKAITHSVQYEGAETDWLDAIIVAMDIIKRETEFKKFKNFKIVLFNTFASAVNDDNVSSVIKGLKTMDIDLIVISDSVEYLDQPDEGESQVVFTQKQNKSQEQKLSEQLVNKILDETDGNLCNFDYAIQNLMKFRRRKAKPWFWYCTLEIGSKIKIQTCSTIALKEETHFTWKKESKIPNTKLERVEEYYKNGEKIDIDPKEDLIKAYMLGSTPIPCDESFGASKDPTKKGIKCICFTPRSRISDEFMAGNGSYIVLPKKGQEVSEKMFIALVQAMIKNDFVMIATKVYADGYKRKLAVLIPNTEHECPCLTMIELYYSDHYCNWIFPPLRTRKTNATPEQSEAIDKLIDAMDLTNIYDDSEQPKSLFPLKNLTHISLQHIYETVTKRALNPRQPVPTLDGRLAEALEIPPQIKEKTAEIVQEIKELFPLKEVKKPGKRELIRQLGDIPALPDENPSINQDDVEAQNENNKKDQVLIEVGTVTPAEDFLTLIERNGENFAKICIQIRNIIGDLLFKSMTDQNEKITKAMIAFRNEAIFYGPWEYNDWIKELKNEIIIRKKFNFWEDIVVKEHLGLIPTSESDLVVSISDEEAEEFYHLNVAQSNVDTTNVDENVDDLFDNM